MIDNGFIIFRNHKNDKYSASYFHKYGEINNFSSYIWTTCFSDIGDGEIVVPIYSQADIIDIKINDIVVRKIDCVDETAEIKNVYYDGYKHWLYPMIVRSVTIQTNADEINQIIKLKEVKDILNQRVIKKDTWEVYPHNEYNKICDIVKCIITESQATYQWSYCGGEINRAFSNPDLIFETKSKVVDTTTSKPAGGNAGNLIADLLKSQNKGWEAVLEEISENVIVIKIYLFNPVITDITYSYFNHNLTKCETEENVNNYKNAAIAEGGQWGTNNLRIGAYTYLDHTAKLTEYPKSYDRFEMYVSNDSDKRTLTDENAVVTDLIRLAKENLSSKNMRKGFVAEIKSDYKNKKLGHYVTIDTGLGYKDKIQIVSYIESLNANGYSIKPVFNS